MNETLVIGRKTKYCQAIENLLVVIGHATNAELLNELRKTYPELSATTVHRATARLASRGEIAVAPSSKDGSMQYDANTTPHDHFQCTRCGRLKDTNIKDSIIPLLESSIEGCHISGNLIVGGLCKHCNETEPK